MAPRKLSDSDKSDIIELYRQPGQTTSTLAEQYGVSNSTISRILKTTLPPDEYSALISQKRMAGTDKKIEMPAATKVEAAQSQDSQPAADDTAEPSRVEPPKLKTTAEKEDKEKEVKEKEIKEKGVKEKSTASRRRRQTSKQADDDEQLHLLSPEATDDTDSPVDSRPQSPPAPILVSATADSDEDDDDDDLLGLDETLGDDFGDDDIDDEDDDEDEDSDDATPQPKFHSGIAVEIMPLGTAVLPKPCYLVVDMRSELITRPLSEFADLGQIPTSEEKAQTLPVFDNHRVARRFSRNKQRVIKVPDGNIITRTSPYLQAKGITRLLVDGQVYDLAGKD